MPSVRRNELSRSSTTVDENRMRHRHFVVLSHCDWTRRARAYRVPFPTPLPTVRRAGRQPQFPTEVDQDSAECPAKDVQASAPTCLERVTFLNQEGVRAQVPPVLRTISTFVITAHCPHSMVWSADCRTPLTSIHHGHPAARRASWPLEVAPHSLRPVPVLPLRLCLARCPLRR